MLNPLLNSATYLDKKFAVQIKAYFLKAFQAWHGILVNGGGHWAIGQLVV